VCKLVLSLIASSGSVGTIFKFVRSDRINFGSNGQHRHWLDNRGSSAAPAIPAPPRGVRKAAVIAPRRFEGFAVGHDTLRPAGGTGVNRQRIFALE
jgi:hypothetical protein